MGQETPTDDLSSLKRLPALELRGMTGVMRLDPRESLVLLLMRDAALPRAHKYIAQLEAHLSEFRAWDTRLIVITEKESIESGLETASTSPEKWHTLGIAAGKSALIIADRWGEVYFAQQTETFADMLSPEQVEEWVRYLATQCPECGVIDESGRGEWDTRERNAR